MVKLGGLPLWWVLAHGFVALALSCSDLDGLRARNLPDAGGGSTGAETTDSRSRGGASGSQGADGGSQAGASGSPGADGGSPGADSGPIEGSSEEDAGQTWGWTEVSDDELSRQGVVRVLAGRNCSGVLISHRWLLTAAHCLCDSHVWDPNSVLVMSRGSRFDGNPASERLLYTVRAERVVVHGSHDVALLKVDWKLPFVVPPLIYDGKDGLEVKNQSARAWGFGPNRLDANNQPIGAGQELTSASLWIDEIAEVGQKVERPANCDEPTKPELTSLGPIARHLSGAPAGPVEGAQGGPLFIGGDDVEKRVLVGVLKGTTGSSYAYTGLWAIRDWIRNTADDVSSAKACSTPMMNSQGLSQPAVAEGPDGALHIVAVQNDGAIRHWRRSSDGTLSAGALVPGARTDLKPGLGKEYRAAPGESLKLGLVFRDAESQELTYAQWSEPTSWLNPMRVLAVRNPKAVALGDGGFMAFVTQDDQMGGSFHDFERGFADLPTTNAPGIDPSRGISLHYSSGPLGPYVWVAYRTTDNRWIELAGTIKPSDAGVLGWEFVWPRSMKPVETDWQSAVIAGSTNGPGYAASRASAASS